MPYDNRSDYYQERDYAANQLTEEYREVLVKPNVKRFTTSFQRRLCPSVAKKEATKERECTLVIAMPITPMWGEQTCCGKILSASKPKTLMVRDTKGGEDPYSALNSTRVSSTTDARTDHYGIGRCIVSWREAILSMGGFLVNRLFVTVHAFNIECHQGELMRETS